MKRGFLSVVGSILLAGSFLLSTGTASQVQAQGWRWERQRQYEEQRRREEIWRQRQIERQQRGYYGIDRNRNGIDDRYEYNRYGYGRSGDYYGNYGYGNYGYNNSDYQRGYRDGLQRGRSGLNQSATAVRAIAQGSGRHLDGLVPRRRGGRQCRSYKRRSVSKCWPQGRGNADVDR